MAMLARSAANASGGRRRAASLLLAAPPLVIRSRAGLLLAGLLLPLLWLAPRARAEGPAGTQGPEIVVTEIFVGHRPDIDPVFLSEGGRDLAAQAGDSLVRLLAANPGWRVHPDFLSNPARDVGALAQQGERVYVRGVVTRADKRRTGLFGDLQQWVFSLGLRLEFFDIRSGQIWFGQDVTVRAPLDAASEPPPAERMERYRTAFSSALREAARRAGVNYRPGSLEAVCTAWTADSLLVLDRGSRSGLPSGATGEIARGEERWLVRVQELQSDWCLARVLASTGAGRPTAGLSARFSGVNGVLAQDGPQLAVAGAALPPADQLDGNFDVDPATLGQWLHDALVDSRAFNLLPPLLAGKGDGGSELAAAFFRAQSVFSAAGDVRQDEIIGHRSLPQGLVRLVVTHADLSRATRLGYEALILRLGLLLEIYDRRTHEVLLSQALEGSRMEKHNETYRRVDLGAAWRELAGGTLDSLARLAAQAWRPGQRELAVESAGPEDTFLVKGDAAVGERGVLVRPGEEVRDRNRKVVGRRARQYGVAEVTTAAPRPAARVSLGDGSTTPAVGDLLRLPAVKARPSARIRSVEVGGPDVNPLWQPGELRVTLWAQQALEAGGRFNMLAPEALAAEVAAAEVALAGGEFRAVDLGEILLNDPPEPQVLVDVQVPLGQWERVAARYKADLTFQVGVKLFFFDAAGEPLLLFTDSAGQRTNQRKLGRKYPDAQVLQDGKVMQGVAEEDFPDQLDKYLRLCLTDLGVQLGGAAAGH